MMSDKNQNSVSSKNNWLWIPSLYLFQSIPFHIVILTSVIIYKTMGVSLTSISFWTSLLYLPWTLKLLWSPLVDRISSKRNWVLATQFLVAFTILGIGMSLQTTQFYSISITLFLFLAFLSASHDISADGFYMLALNQHQQSFFVGIRNSFYRLGKLLALGAIALIAGYVLDKTDLTSTTFEVKVVKSKDVKIINILDNKTTKINKSLHIQCIPQVLQVPLESIHVVDSNYVSISLCSRPVNKQPVVLTIIRKDGAAEIDIHKKQNNRIEFNENNWNIPIRYKLTIDHNLNHITSTTFKISAGNIGLSWTVSILILGFFLLILALYHFFVLPKPFEPKHITNSAFSSYAVVFKSFFSKDGFLPALLFFILYRLGESQLVKVSPAFLIENRNLGGLGLTTSQFGFAYGTIGILCLTLGGILGGIAASKWGLKKIIKYMALAMNIPILFYVYLAVFQPQANSISVFFIIGVEEMGYGFGFTAYMLYMLNYVGESQFKTAEYAIGTSLMAVGMMLPGMLSGKMVEILGYTFFFIYVFICQIPGFICLHFLKIDPSFGRKV